MHMGGGIIMLYHINEDGSISPVAPRINDAAPSDKTTYSGAHVDSLIADAYDDTATYAVGDYVMYGSKLYKCTTAVSTAETFDPTKWAATTIMAEIAGA